MHSLTAPAVICYVEDEDVGEDEQDCEKQEHTAKNLGI